MNARLLRWVLLVPALAATLAFAGPDDSVGAAATLAEAAEAHRRAGRFDQALEANRERAAMLLRLPAAAASLKVRALRELADSWRAVGRPDEAEAEVRKALAFLAVDPGDAADQGPVLQFGLALTLREQGRYNEAEESYRTVLRLLSDGKEERELRVRTLVALAGTYSAMSLPESATHSFREAEEQALHLGNRLRLAVTRAARAAHLSSIVGQSGAAVATAREAVAALLPEDADKPEYPAVLRAAARVTSDASRNDEARELLKRAIDAGEAQGQPNTASLASMLNLSANLEARAGRLQESARILRLAVAVQKAAPARCHPCLVATVLNLSDREQLIGNRAEAARLRVEGLALAAEDPHLDTQAQAFHGLARFHARERQYDAATFFGKQAINALQQLRERMATLDPELQRGFVGKREAVYRETAGWMVRTGRIAEAQQVLDLLKVEEMRAFSRGAGLAPGALALSGDESGAGRQIATMSRDVVRLGKELAELPKEASAQARRREIESQLENARTAFDTYLAGLNQRFAGASAERNRELGAMQLERLVSMRRTLAELGEGVVMLHYVVSPDRVSIIVTTPKVQVAREKAIREADLNSAVFALRTTLQDPAADPLPAARRFYDIVLAPVAADLEQAGARTLMLSLDGVLRYVPFAALHDGSRYVAARYGTVLFTAAARDKLKDTPKASWRMAGLGVTRAHAGFESLPAVRQELELIRDRAVPGEVFLDDAFTAQRLKASLDANLPLLHIASHFRFKPGTEADSFLLLGDGSRLSLRDIRVGNLDFGAVDLVTLSACETAMGGGRDDAGREIEGLGALLQNQGAKGVMATLWPVNDLSTARFMWSFYSARGNASAVTKAEALRQAQIGFLQRTGADARLAHPFYWAPFILMGNWL